jgi:hypothetical protein
MPSEREVILRERAAYHAGWLRRDHCGSNVLDMENSRDLRYPLPDDGPVWRLAMLAQWKNDLLAQGTDLTDSILFLPSTAAHKLMGEGRGGLPAIERTVSPAKVRLSNELGTEKPRWLIRAQDAR